MRMRDVVMRRCRYMSVTDDEGYRIHMDETNMMDEERMRIDEKKNKYTR
jgi:hypothetical protein